MPKKYIIAGIGTEIGKTVISAMLTEALQADYWKPIQSGDLHHTDTDKVKSLVKNPKSVFHPEAYRLIHPMSPHAAADLEKVEINPEKLIPPITDNHLIIELAGGLMVPLNHHFMNIDFIKQLNLPVILVSRYYLGSINHTLLSIKLLEQYLIPIAGIIFNGEKNQPSRDVILEYTGLKCLGEIPELKEINKEIIAEYAKLLIDKI